MFQIELTHFRINMNMLLHFNVKKYERYGINYRSDNKKKITHRYTLYLYFFHLQNKNYPIRSDQVC